MRKGSYKPAGKSEAGRRGAAVERFDGGNGKPTIRETILSVAADLFATRGFANVSIRDICHECGITLPMVYYYYGNKQKLFEAVVEQKITLESFMNGLLAAIGEKEDAASQLLTYLRHYLAHFPIGVITVGYYLRDSASLEADSVKRLLGDLKEARRVLIHILEAGVASGQFDTSNASLAAAVLTGALNGFLIRWNHFQEAFDREETAKFIYKSFLEGIKARPKEPRS